jgi:hypothetical protein
MKQLSSIYHHVATGSWQMISIEFIKNETVILCNN